MPTIHLSHQFLQPVELWRQPIGPGCSSFAIRGDFLYTQEQRGENEIVSCYKLTTGEPMWKHSDKARFWDSHAGAGPRSTPTLRDSCVYTQGGTGILNALDARDGTVIWSRNTVSDTEVEHSGWGYTGSPLVVDDLVIVAVVGKLAAYDRATGRPRWFSSDSTDSYSSPHLLTIDGVEQVLLMSGAGAASFTPANGEMLWEHKWPCETRIVQPALTADGDILISAGEKRGMRLINVKQGSNGWNIEDRWTTNRIRPDFNDFVVHKGHVYGYDGLNLACIDIKEGNRKWREGRYGGQLILLADQDLLLIFIKSIPLLFIKSIPVN